MYLLLGEYDVMASETKDLKLQQNVESRKAKTMYGSESTGINRAFWLGNDGNSSIDSAASRLSCVATRVPFYKHYCNMKKSLADCTETSHNATSQACVRLFSSTCSAQLHPTHYT
ncbi:hypothetical protein COCC4DRAFT_20540 [Bipolaris maydis ATCC 48331]|uniref:Uncharacterized protein n=2 Tax=Cochliobolus heterostrophus TaxID=5016 RepID=M2UUJ4_COCH5|nr:uncharacterized protein COCC4DRAFT_20540 [Bipolaris maydis ATCC 48331]EMD91542.1 hypothetical protein COCHEDRAFT_1030345 [Bipolaris maydis C5]ENI08701.1 hypothetical protein COCC4DRAFT_20540 [Bipolaris maydis ATCC 48331]